LEGTFGNGLDPLCSFLCVLSSIFYSFKQESNKLELSEWKKGERGKS